MESVDFTGLPEYLKREFEKLRAVPLASVPVLSLPQIRNLPSSVPPSSHDRQEQYAQLLLLRHSLTLWMCQLSEASNVRYGVCPKLILQRARVHEALAYADLALADAYVAFSVATGEEEDLRAVHPDGTPWKTSESKDSEGAGVDSTSNGADQNQSENSDAEYSEEGHSEESVTKETRGEEAEQEISRLKLRALRIIVRGLKDLGCTGELRRWQGLLNEVNKQFGVVVKTAYDDGDEEPWTIHDDVEDEMPNSTAVREADGMSEDGSKNEDSIFGFSRREIHPWNEYEPPNRMSEESLRAINKRLLEMSSGFLEVRKAVLPSLELSTSDPVKDHMNEDTGEVEENTQLGLFALCDLSPGGTVLREYSVLTAIRPHDAPLCDACAADLATSSISSSSTTTHDSDPDDHDTLNTSGRTSYGCPGCGVPFCSSHCLSTALSTYHNPNTDDSTTEASYPPASSPFCPGTSAHADIHAIGRAESSDTPEWDLYFLLIARCIMMAETTGQHPLEVEEVKWLWGDFNTSPPLPATSNRARTSAAESRSTTARHQAETNTNIKRTLPFSLLHTITLPLSFFTTLLLSKPDCAPYSANWLKRYDFWIIQTLYAKFRGVADARQSTWDGKPETAGVYGLWCLANHSCNPNVEWSAGGLRRFSVRDEKVWSKEVKWDGETEGQNVDGNDKAETKDQAQWAGIRKGEEIWNHYTDVREEDYRVRRWRLKEVLGGDCLCERCVWEERHFTQRAKERLGREEGDSEEAERRRTHKIQNRGLITSKDCIAY